MTNAIVLDAAVLRLLEGPVPSLWDLGVIAMSGFCRRKFTRVHRAITLVVESCLYTVSPLAEAMLSGILSMFGVAIFAGLYVFGLEKSSIAGVMQAMMPLEAWSLIALSAGIWHGVGLIAWPINPRWSIHTRRLSALMMFAAYFLLTFAFVIAAPYNLAFSFCVPLLCGAGCVCHSLGGPDERYIGG